MDTMALVSARLREAASPSRESAATLRTLFTAHGGLTFAELEACGQRLTAELTTTWSEIAEESDVRDIQRSIRPRHDKVTADFGRPYHSLQSGGLFTFDIRCFEPVALTVSISPLVGVADSRDERFAFAVVDANRPHVDPLLLRTDDLHPATTTSAGERIQAWLQEAYDRALGELTVGIKQQLHDRGFAP